MSTDYIFKVKTTEGYAIKALVEILQSNLKSFSLEVSNEGIKILRADDNMTILVHLFLQADNFVSYSFRSSQPLHLGINPTFLHKMVKTIKKKESVELYITTAEPTKLYIQVYNAKGGKGTESNIVVQNSLPIQEVEVPTGYRRPITVVSSEFQKMLKGLASIGTQICVKANNGVVTFSSDSGNVMGRSISFGEENDDEEIQGYDSVFKTIRLTKLQKLSALSERIFVSHGTNALPLCLRTDVSHLGKITIYIKSTSTIAEENES